MGEGRRRGGGRGWGRRRGGRRSPPCRPAGPPPRPRAPARAAPPWLPPCWGSERREAGGAGTGGAEMVAGGGVSKVLGRKRRGWVGGLAWCVS